MQSNNASIQTIINRARVARLSTVDHENIPHIVPVVFVFDGHYYYIPLDKKRKETETVEKLKRVRNIQNNPNVALLIDEYDEDWSKLVFVMIQGTAHLIGKEKKGNENNKYGINNSSLIKEIHTLLCQKYHQYKEIGIGQYCIVIQPQKIIYWKNQQ
jgi:PPOX class probable F420-dependent enzyme